MGCHELQKLLNTSLPNEDFDVHGQMPKLRERSIQTCEEVEIRELFSASLLVRELQDTIQRILRQKRRIQFCVETPKGKRLR